MTDSKKAIHKYIPKLFLAPLSLAVSTFVLGICTTYIVFKHIKSQNDEIIATETRKFALKINDDIVSKLSLYEYGLLELRSHVLTQYPANISLTQFEKFALSHNIKQLYPGARGFGLVRKVPSNDLFSYNTYLNKLYDKSIEIQILDNKVNEHFVLELMYPIAQNIDAIGVDIASEPKRRHAAQAAANTGKSQLTAPITLVQATAKNKPSFLLLMPLYNSWLIPTSDKLRQQNAIGWLTAPLVMDEILANINIDATLQKITIADVTDGESDPFYSNTNSLMENQYSSSVHQRIFGRTWLINIAFHPSNLQNFNTTNTHLILTVGGFASIVFALLSFVLRLSYDIKRKAILQQAQLASIVENSLEGIVSTTKEGIILSWNNGAELLLGIKSEYAIGKLFTSIILPNTAATTTSNLFKKLNQGLSISHKELALTKPTKHKIYFSMAAFPILNNQKQVSSLSFIFRDITQAKKVENTLRKAKKEAEEANESKSEFLATVSHEIRTPMNATLGMLQLVKRTQLNLQQKEYIHKAESSAKSLLRLINDILDYSKINAKKLTLEKHEFDIAELIDDLCVILSANKKNKFTDITLDIDPSLPKCIITDKLRLLQILTNLSNNALKFTDAGEVALSIKTLKQNKQSYVVQFAVQDTGIGISKEQQERIFKEFEQAENSTSREYGGTGLGLAISKMLIELMGGQLYLSSERHTGSRFWFSLELPVKSQHPYLDAPAFNGRHVSVLIVDKNVAVTHSVVTMLKPFDISIDSANNYSDTFRQIDKHNVNSPYDVIIIASDMRTEGGEDLAEATSRYLGDTATKIVILIDYTDVSERLSRENTHQYFDLMTKPVIPVQLFNVLTRCVNQTRDIAVEDNSQNIDIPLSGFRILVVEDNELSREVAYELLRDVGAKVDVAKNGAQALDKIVEERINYDVVILDLRLPDMSGFDITHQIRSIPELAQLPILAMTASTSAEDSKACIAAGMNAHMPKPIDIDIVTQKILSLVGKVPVTIEIETQESTDQDELIESISAIMKRFGNNQSLVKRMLSIFESDTMAHFSHLQQSLSTADKAGSLSALHTIKGLSSTIGALALHRHTKALEKTLEAANEDVDFNEFSNSSQALVALFRKSCNELHVQFNVTTQHDNQLTLTQHLTITTDIMRRLEALMQQIESGELVAIDTISQIFAENPDSLALFELKNEVEALNFSKAKLKLDTLLKTE